MVVAVRKVLVNGITGEMNTGKKISGRRFIDAEAKGKSRLAHPGIVKLRKTVDIQAAQADP